MCFEKEIIDFFLIFIFVFKRAQQALFVVQRFVSLFVCFEKAFNDHWITEMVTPIIRLRDRQIDRQTERQRDRQRESDGISQGPLATKLLTRDQVHRRTCLNKVELGWL